MRTIALSGFMAAGKSTVGPLVAERTGLPFVDTDAELARREGRSVADVFRADGEAAFRAKERALVTELLADGVPRVLALGGGTVTMRDLRHRLLEEGLVVTLTATPGETLRRAGDLRLRPNLASADPETRAEELLAARADAYAECHLTLATDGVDPDSLADAVASLGKRDPLVVPLGERTYPIDLVDDDPTTLTDAVARLAPSSVVIVTDASVHRARFAQLRRALEPLALPGIEVTLTPGEAQKNVASVGAIWDAALGANIDRDAVIVAFGGGVVGDLAGFAAATLLRGIRVLQVPTSLLAVLDASVGGKTGFDHPAGKNLVGAIHQPSAVVTDLAHLSSLSHREFVSGFGEAVKVALALDAPLRDELAAFEMKDRAALASIVRRSVAAKIRVVRDDERERGPRVLLNLGHTIGHALEVHGNYHRHLHGEAVALGLVEELRASVALGITPREILDEAKALLERLGLPTTVERATLHAAFRWVASDKKRRGDSLLLPTVTKRGHATLTHVSMDAYRRALGI